MSEETEFDQEGKARGGRMNQTPIRRVVQPVTALGNNASDNWDDPDYLERAVPLEDIMKEQKRAEGGDVSEETEFDWDGKETPYKISVADYFAGLAMQTIVTSYLHEHEHYIWRNFANLTKQVEKEHEWSMAMYDIAERCYEMARVMISRRADNEDARQEKEREDIRQEEKERKNIEMLGPKEKT